MRPFLALTVASLAVGCIETGFTPIESIDFFTQKRRQAVDLLVVVDNSCSMFEEQDKLARNFDALITTMSEADVDWQLAVTTTDVESERFRGLLVGGDDEIILRGPTGELDRVEYDRDWPFEPGVALALDGDKLRFTFNDSRLNWCPGVEEYGPGHFGTPGLRNAPCAGGSAEVPELGPDLGPRAPGGDDLVISEILSQSLGDPHPDSLCEWFEITSTTDDTLDLSGVEVADRGNNLAVFPDGTTLEPRGVLVVGRSLTEACGAQVDVAFAEGFSLNDNRRVIDASTPDGDELFSEAVAQGTTGTGVEMGLEAARLVFEQPQYSGSNHEWLRPDATLAVLVVSDEDDVSPYPVDAYIRYFSELKGDVAYREPSLVTVSAVVATAPGPRPDLPACENDDTQAFYARRYLEAALTSEGLAESICEEDFAPIVGRLGLTLSGLEAEFALSDCPRLDTLVVELYDADQQLVRELELGVDFTYELEGNKLVFETDQIPPSEYTVKATFLALLTCPEEAQ